jgi:23S rRNA (adenine-N6)-dimethyltransferase
VPLRRVDAIVQWELAAKQAAVWPATRRSVYWQAWWELSITGRLSRTSFAPVPSVDAAVLTLARRSHPLVPPGERDRYDRFLRAAFDGAGPVRGALRASLSAHELKRLAPGLGFAPEARPRDLDARQWAALYAFARERGRI